MSKLTLLASLGRRPAALALIGALMGCLFTLSMVLFALVIGLGAILQSIQ